VDDEDATRTSPSSPVQAYFVRTITLLSGQLETKSLNSYSVFSAHSNDITNFDSSSLLQESPCV